MGKKTDWTVEKVTSKFEKMEGFKLPNVFIKDNDYFDVFVKITTDISNNFENVKDAFNNIEKLEWQYLDGTGIFELTFRIEDTTNVLFELDSKI